jgi:hypothetical protein
MSYRDIQLDARPPFRFRLLSRLRRGMIARHIYRRRWNRMADVLVLSFPSSGRTWLQLMIARALSRHLGIQGELNLHPHVLVRDCPGVPRIKFKHDDNPHLKLPSELVTRKSEYRDRKVVLLTRDIRDLVVSAFFQLSRREKRFGGDLHEFLRCPRGSVDTMIRFYNMWADSRDVPRAFLKVRYEDLHADAAGQLRRVFDFAGLGSVPDETLQEAAEFARFENMRRMEAADAMVTHRLRPADPTDKESFKTRRGKVGGYTDYLSPEEVEWLNRRLREELHPDFLPDDLKA